jgi:aspartyl-tRNA(Asn)/glutamyl-tRNA(Gln) amidotransferase subunit C
MANIDREQLLHVASLARLELREEEVERLGAQLNDILAAVSKVSELDLSDVPPTSHPLEVANVWAEDEPGPCLTVEEALANAPDRDGAFFKVPPGGSGLGEDHGPGLIPPDVSDAGATAPGGSGQ